MLQNDVIKCCKMMSLHSNACCDIQASALYYVDLDIFYIRRSQATLKVIHYTLRWL